MRGARQVARLCALAWALGAAPDALRAQSSDTLFATGVRAYKNLEFDLAAWLLRRDLAKVSAAGAPIAARTEGLVYLGAADLFRASHRYSCLHFTSEASDRIGGML